MPLPVRQDLKDYLRIETAAEDTLLDSLLLAAENFVESVVQRPLEAVSEAYVDEAGGECGTTRRLVYPVVPIASDVDVAVTDGNGDVVATTEYRVDRRTGILYGEPGGVFATAPYTITATAGLSAASDWADRIEPVINQAILGYASHLYHRRNPAAVQESAGGGASTTYANDLFPQDVRAMVMPFRLERFA